ncbi:MAG: hypothetical protein NTU61_05940, partial [Candidatus Altiarchaeota archaeon]|nr:hypothetical protein [Candidatus Altiarchaeota archaeon]
MSSSSERRHRFAERATQLPPEEKQILLAELKNVGELGTHLERIHGRPYSVGEVKEYADVQSAVDCLMENLRSMKKGGVLSRDKMELKGYLEGRLNQAWSNESRTRTPNISEENFRKVVAATVHSLTKNVGSNICYLKGEHEVMETRMGGKVLNALGAHILAEAELLAEAGVSVSGISNVIKNLSY